MDCRCDENIFIREEWLEDVVYTKTGRAGGFDHFHVNQTLIQALTALDHDYLAQKVKIENEPHQTLIKALTALDHDYLAQKVKIENEPQNFQNNNNYNNGDSFIEEFYADENAGEGGSRGNLPAEDHDSEDTLTGEELTDLVDDCRIGVAHNSSSDGGGHYKIIKIETNDLAINACQQQIDAHKNNFTRDTDGNNYVCETLIKKECVELIEDDTRMGMIETHAEDQWSEDTLTASEDVDEIDDGWNLKDGGIALSHGEFIEGIDGWTNDTNEMDGYNSMVQNETIKKEHYDESYSNHNTTKEMEGLCSNRRPTDAENCDTRAMLTEDKDNDIPLSPGEFIEEEEDDDDDDDGGGGNGHDERLSVRRAVNKSEQHYDKNTTVGMISDEYCTVDAKNDSHSSTADDRALSAEKHYAKADSDTDNAKGDLMYSVPEYHVDYDEYGFSLDEAVGESDYAADSDESWEPAEKRKVKCKVKKDLYVCHTCSYKCCKLGLLKRHVKSSKSCKNPYGCNLCGGWFVDGFELKEHVKKHSEKSRKKNYSCFSCSYTAKNSGCLKSHELIHTGEKPYVCSICNYATRQRGNLKTHMKKQHSENEFSKNEHSEASRRKDPFVCHSCGYKFDWLSLLRSHVRSSKTCELPYGCNLCDKRYWGEHALKYHMKKHSGKYPCDVCSHRAQSAFDLKRHKLTHTGEKPHSCLVYNLRFRQTGQRNTHEDVI